MTKKELFQNIVKFLDRDIFYFSASLSFFTILSMLPILALILVGLSYLSGMPMFDGATEQFIKNILELLNPTRSQQLQTTISSFLSNTNDLGLFGLIYFLFAFALFFRDYDYIVNKIHRIKQKKIHKMILTYLGFLIFLPIGFLLFSFVSALLKLLLFDFWFVENLLRFLTGWMFFVLLFKVSINQNLTKTALFFSAFLTTIFLSLFKYMFIFYTLHNKMYATIYGSFSVLMLFFVWLYVSWIILLFGVKFCKILQNRQTFSFLWYNIKTSKG
jgi:membrane protein